jgi:hypothetical protein
MIRQLEEKALPKLQEYEQHLRTMGDGRNSCSKTDRDATFMRMKEDRMGNGQLKPVYNIQIGTENQFITNYALCQDRDDMTTLPSFVELHHDQYGEHVKELCADAGYGSEKSCRYPANRQIEAYVKYSYFHKERKQAFKNSPFLQDNLYYNAEKDYFVCPTGQYMRCILMIHANTKS